MLLEEIEYIVLINIYKDVIKGNQLEVKYMMIVRIK